ncbi:MAG: helix-turn-helix transcriptional regulator, partial [Chloroflexota bacterium]
VMAYLMRLRIERAKQLLLEHDLMIGQVGEQVGIEDLRYFSTRFRRETGMTPSQYRLQKGTRFIDS